MKLRFYFKLLKNILLFRLSKNFNKFSMPYKYTFITTYKCNSKCKTCGIWKIYKDNPRKLMGEMNKEEMKKVIESIKEDVLWLNFTGGEPLLKEGLSEVIKYAYDNCSSLGMINIASNGLIPKATLKFFEDFVPHCKNIDIFVTLSLDALGKDYSKTRGLDGFDKVMKSFYLLMELSKKYSNLHVSFQLTISKLNADKAIETFEFIKNYGTPIVTFAHTAALFHNKELNIDVRSSGKETIIKPLEKIEKKYPIRYLRNIIPKIYLRLAKSFLVEGKAPIACSAGYSTITIDPYGEVLPCPYLEKSAGNLKHFDYDMKRVLMTKEAIEVKKIVKTCRRCWQNCEAMPSIFAHPASAVLEYIKSR